ncbi:hypothetical protein GF391_00385 [Candidatus Uhrbacteria bacterium]|nr:hypothetical protein [Candidatus Uhrbacteria bacterium]
MIKKRRKTRKKNEIQCVPCKVSLMGAVVFAVLAGILVYLSLETLRIKDRKTMQSLRYSQAQYLEQLDSLQAKVDIYENAPPASEPYVSDPISTRNGEVYIAQDRAVDIFWQDGRSTRLIAQDIPANPNGLNPPVLSPTNNPDLALLKTIVSQGSGDAYYYINTDSSQIITVEAIGGDYLTIQLPQQTVRIEPNITCEDDECILSGVKSDNTAYPLPQNIVLTDLSPNGQSKYDPLATLSYLGLDLELENIYINLAITKQSGQLLKDINLQYNLKTGSFAEADPKYLLTTE